MRGGSKRNIFRIRLRWDYVPRHYGVRRGVPDYGHRAADVSVSVAGIRSTAGEGARRSISLLLCEEVIEGFHGAELVVLDVEDGVELGDVQHVVNFLAER